MIDGRRTGSRRPPAGLGLPHDRRPRSPPGRGGRRLRGRPGPSRPPRRGRRPQARRPEPARAGHGGDCRGRGPAPERPGGWRGRGYRRRPRRGRRAGGARAGPAGAAVPGRGADDPGPGPHRDRGGRRAGHGGHRPGRGALPAAARRRAGGPRRAGLSRGDAASPGRRGGRRGCLLSPQHLFAVGQAYETFGDTADEEVVRVLELARAFERVERREVAIPMSEGLELPGRSPRPGHRSASWSSRTAAEAGAEAPGT